MRTIRRAALATTVALAAMAAPAQEHHGPVRVEAGSLVIRDGYARATGAAARTGAAYVVITNTGDADDRLLEVRSDVAARVELHTTDLEDGIARMRAMTDGIPLPAGETAALEQGGLHVILMSLNAPMAHDADVALTLVFEVAGAVDVALPVDLRHNGGHGDHGAMEPGSGG